MEQTNEHLARKVGIIGLSANLINIVVGAGIFALPAIVAAGLGSHSIFAYLFCGFLILLVLLGFAEIGSKITTSGGAYTYIETVFGPYAGFLTAILFTLSAVTADAAVANAVADVISSFLPILSERMVRIPFFIIVFGLLGYINVRGIQNGISLVKLVTVFKLMPLLLLIIISWGSISYDNLAFEGLPSLDDLGKTSLILFFAFQGAESGLSISGEVKSPNRTIPRAIILSILVVLVLYILIQTISQGVMGEALAAQSKNPLGSVAAVIVGPIGFTLMSIGAAVSMFGNLSSTILSLPRVIFRASMDKVLPFSLISKVHPKFETPYVAVIVYASIGCLFASLGGFEKLAILSSATMLLVYLGVSISVIKLRKVKPEVSGFKIPGGMMIPLTAILIILWLLSNLALKEGILMVVAVAVLSLLYLLKTQFNSGKKKNAAQE